MCNLIPQSTNRDDESRIDYYLEHLKLDRHALPPLIHYWVADGYYSNNKYIDGGINWQSVQFAYGFKVT